LCAYGQIPELDLFTSVNALLNGWTNYYRYANNATNRFLYLTGVAYWLTAHYLGRKHRCSIKKVMRIRYGRDPKSGKKALYTTNDTGKRLFLWNKPPKWRSLLNPTVQAKDVQPLPITSWAGGHSDEQRVEAQHRAEGHCEHCGTAADKLFVHHPKRLGQLRKPKQGPANVIASAQEQQVKLLCWECHKQHHPQGWHDGKTIRRQHIPGEPDAAMSGPSGSEGAGQKRASAMK
jgi:hypothetical protein